MFTFIGPPYFIGQCVVCFRLFHSAINPECLEKGVTNVSIKFLKGKYKISCKGMSYTPDSK